jgi:AcrR family transcriptional regulator
MNTSEALVSREKIMDDATRLWVQSGYASISMREIAEACGMSKAGLYYHFKDKEDLLLAVLKEHLKLMESALDSCKCAGKGIRAKITFFVDTILAMPPEKRAIIRLASQEMSHLSTQIRENFNIIYYQSFIGRVEDLLSEGIKNGELRPMDVKVGVWILLGMMYPFFNNSQNQLQSGNVRDTILSVFFEGTLQHG